MSNLFFKGKTNKSNVINVLKTLFIMLSFFFMDFGLRQVLKDDLSFEKYAYVPNLFTVCWILIFLSLIFLWSKKVSKIIYGVLYFVWAAYIIVQKGYYAIFKDFLFINDFAHSGEGAHYLSFVGDIINTEFVVFIVITLVVGILGIIWFPSIKLEGKLKYAKLAPAIIGVIGLFVIPRVCYGGQVNYKAWNAWESPAFEYHKFSSSVSDMELTGVYHYVARDIQLKFANKLNNNDEEKIEKVNEFFAKREPKKDNAMTGVFEGKNIIIVMMESLDDWVVNEENTPTIWNMMQKGINFTNMYTPLYTTGCTFNTEFSFNTGNFPYSNGTTVYTLSDNDFNESLANQFEAKGYTANSFHKGTAEFYKRGMMHEAFGYEKYHSYLDYAENEQQAEIDTFLPENNELYSIMTGSKPFMDFIVTYSAHLPYNETNHLSTYAMEKYPQYNIEGRSQEVNYLSAQARITDDMFKELLDRLEADGLLEDTVIVGYTDHYSYGITDSELLQQLTVENGTEIAQRTPAFVYCKGNEMQLQCDKIMQTIDFVPTLSNMFNLDCPKVLGRDVFDESHSGYVIFPNNSWLTDKAYFSKGELKYNNGMTQEEIDKMNEFVQEFYTINDYVLDTNYYRNKE